MKPADLPIEQPVRQSLPQVVAQQLLELIRSGVLAPGQQLPSEVDLKERFGVGRSTIREALNGLVLVGAIEVRHGQGAFVLRNRPDMPGGLDEAVRRSVTEELFEAREAMEVASARLAAERATEEDLQAIRELLDQAELKVGETGAAVEEASRFHLLIAEAAHNELFVQFIQMILDDLNERGVDLSLADGYAEWELAAHREVLGAISSGSGQQGQRAMARHLNDMRQISVSGWDVFRVRSPK